MDPESKGGHGFPITHGKKGKKMEKEKKPT